MFRHSVPALAISLGLCLAGLGTAASAQTFTGKTVNATDNIFGAGYGDAPDPDGNNTGGTIATGYALTAGINRVLSFSSVTGTVNADTNATQTGGPDGYDFANDTLAIAAYRSISGITADNPNNDLALLGVFTSGTPTGTAPASEDITPNASSLTFSPLLNQTFFIGDGLTGTGTGTVQKFYVPNGATTLTLGFADADNFQGNPDYYADNAGFDTASFSITAPAAVPETSTTVSFGLLLALGLGGLVLARKKSVIA